MESEYLTENKLFDLLNNIYDNEQCWIHDKIVENSNIRNRPDFRCKKLKLIIEFNGDNNKTYPGHYSSSNIILADNKKKITYEEMGYKVIEWPYFVQPSSEIIKFLLNIDVNYKQTYKHGFIDGGAKLPADFCELGIERFENDLSKFHFIKNDIINSIKDKIIEKGNIKLVLPKKLYYLVD